MWAALGRDAVSMTESKPGVFIFFGSYIPCKNFEKACNFHKFLLFKILNGGIVAQW
jgi:hypothetical protein